jgi:hypothetical protein
MKLFVALISVTALSGCGELVRDADADANQDGASKASDAAIEFCGFDSGGEDIGNCPPGWHCSLSHYESGYRNVCCPLGKNGFDNLSDCVAPK